MSRILRLPGYAGVGLVLAYRYTLGMLFPASCKYHPSCSRYAHRGAASSTASCAGASSPAGGCSAATPGAAAASTTCTTRRSSGAARDPADPPVLAILGPLERPLRWVLEHLHSDVGLTWAWSIVVLTIIVRLAMVPLTVRQIHSMQRMQVFLPQMKELQKKYKGDKQKQNEELMKFYREHNINPAASCLPMLVQIPIFFALYFVLKDFEKTVLKNYAGLATWAGCTSSRTSPTTSQPHWSGYLLVVIYAGSQVASTYFMSTTMDKTQRILFMVLPLGFVFFILSGSVVFPAGLLLYWVTTNLWTVGQGLITRRLVPRTAAAAAEGEKRSSRTAPGTRTSGQPARRSRAGGRCTTDGAPPREAQEAEPRERRLPARSGT